LRSPEVSIAAARQPGSVNPNLNPNLNPNHNLAYPHCGSQCGYAEFQPKIFHEPGRLRTNRWSWRRKFCEKTQNLCKSAELHRDAAHAKRGRAQRTHRAGRGLQRRGQRDGQGGRPARLDAAPANRRQPAPSDTNPISRRWNFDTSMAIPWKFRLTCSFAPSETCSCMAAQNPMRTGPAEKDKLRSAAKPQPQKIFLTG